MTMKIETDRDIILSLIKKAKGGEEITLTNRLYIIDYVDARLLMVGDGSIEIDEQIQVLFPVEWEKAQQRIDMRINK